LVFEEKFCKEILPAPKFGYEGDSIFIFHGHQASLFYENYNYIANFVLRYLANPLRIKNHSPAYDSKRDTKLKSMSIIFPSSFAGNIPLPMLKKKRAWNSKLWNTNTS
jgi:hypothetical protein